MNKWVWDDSTLSPLELVVNALVHRQFSSANDTACRQLVDLRDAYTQQALSTSFQKEFQRFMDKHRHRKALMTRLVKAGLCRAF